MARIDVVPAAIARAVKPPLPSVPTVNVAGRMRTCGPFCLMITSIGVTGGGSRRAVIVVDAPRGSVTTGRSKLSAAFW